MLDLDTLQTLVSLLILVITWLIVQPLRTSIDGLNKTLEELKTEIHKTYNDLNDLRERVSRGENAITSAHKRLDEHGDRLHELETNHV